jgi:hypothetical protein
MSDTKLIAVITEDQDPRESYPYKLEVKTYLNSDEKIIDAIEAAAHEYLHTKDGRTYLEQACNCFNYGDAFTVIPDRICWKHGWKVLGVPEHDTITVDHNTRLVPDDLDE